MGKITNFTWSEFWDVQDKYNDMMCEIEERAFEVACDFGKPYMISQITEIFFNHDGTREYVVVEFCKDVEGDEEFEYFKFNSDWLFSDNYKDELATKEAKKKAAEEADYQEYLRLKAKFENR